jgi:hypothetical protein
MSNFFTANIRNANTRRAYVRACARFLAWCDSRGLALMANHASARTTQLYDRRRDELPLDEVERISIWRSRPTA